MFKFFSDCDNCGRVSVWSNEVVLHLNHVLSASSYSFNCHRCHKFMELPADFILTNDLIDAGVPINQIWKLPEEVFELKLGPAITWDDLIDFHFLMKNPDWFDHLVSPHPSR